MLEQQRCRYIYIYIEREKDKERTMLTTKSCTQPADKRPGCGPLRQVVAKRLVVLFVLKRVVYCFLLITMWMSCLLDPACT